jgi:molecular chaperone GrpE
MDETMRPHMYPQPEDPDQYLHQLPPQPQAQDMDSPPAASPDSADVRARLMRRFEAWLDEVLVDECPPEGMAQEVLDRLQADADTSKEPDTSDLYSLCSALTALTEETRVQGRSFKQLQDGMGQLQDGLGQLHDAPNPVQPLVESVESLLQRDDQILEQQLEQERQSAQQDTLKMTLDVLIDLRDRLTRAKDAAQAKVERPRTSDRGGLLAKLLPSSGAPTREADPTLIKELEMGINRIDEALQHWNVRPIPCVGQTLDPQTMQAVGITDATDVPNNTVMEVCRMGYWWDEKVYRVSQVKVAGNQASAGDS